MEDAPGSPPAQPEEAAALRGAGKADAATRDAGEIDDLRNRLARARADYDNLQKRVARESAAERERNQARVLESFLALLELAHMAARQAEAHPTPISEGVILLAREFDRLVAREGVELIGHVGEASDASRHEVVATEVAEGVLPGCVSRVVQPGYLLGDRVLRFAKVCVAPGD